MYKKLLILFLFFGIVIAQAQTKKITGIVSDESGPLPGVIVLIKGTAKGAETDFDGKYSIKAKIGDVLVFSFIGMETTERSVGKENRINVLLKNGNILEEVIVTAIAVKRKKKSLGYSVSKVSSSALRIRGSKSIGVTSALSGKVSGVSYEKSKVKTKEISEESSEELEDIKPQSGQLTAGEINDIDKWKEWLTLSNNNQFNRVRKDWELISLQNKLEVFVKDTAKKPIVNVTVLCYDTKNNLIQKSKTDVFGKVVIYGNQNDFKLVQVIYNSKVKGKSVLENDKKMSFVFLENEELNDVDVMFTVDATGSMGDEISYLKSEIESIINRVSEKIRKKRVGLTFYRDRGDDYVIRDFNFTTDISKVKENLAKQSAGGGGDYEEAVEEALKVSLAKNWNKKAKAKLLFLVLDAPPHLNQENIATLKLQIKIAQEKGIKIIPIVSSGANKTVEFLMRHFSVLTNGTYVFLTDDSGIGNSHLKPSTSDFKVEKLNDLIVRLIEKYSGV